MGVKFVFSLPDGIFCNSLKIDKFVIKMSVDVGGKWGLYTAWFGVVNGNNELKYPEDKRICDWELEEMNNIISACMAHLASLEDEVRAFERKQSMKGQKFTF